MIINAFVVINGFDRKEEEERERVYLGSFWLLAIIRHFPAHVRNMARFDPPQIQDNPDGWGPCVMPEMYKDLPYQPFSKEVRLGKVLYWNCWKC